MLSEKMSEKMRSEIQKNLEIYENEITTEVYKTLSIVDDANRLIGRKPINDEERDNLSNVYEKCKKHVRKFVQELIEITVEEDKEK